MTNVLKCIIFDMDGTLVDSEKVYLTGYKKTFAKFNVAIADEKLQRFSGLSGEDELNTIDEYTNDRAISEQILTEMIAYAESEFAANRVELKSGAVSLLDYCKQLGLKVGLATSSYEEHARSMLKSLGIIHYFDFFVFGDEISIPKPDPMIFRTAARRSGHQRDECLVIEDSLAGVTAATKARLSVVQIADDIDPIHFANYNVDALSEIKPIIEALLPIAPSE
ncbi:MAG: HAD family phosphatase [Turicibacter sp.]|nr:HAD family phosphatase [Turicibacter sp.]